MRLTVRTLLAWMDGLLSPQDHAALGEKVRTSGVAPALVDRVHEVIARPTLSAPPAAGRGLADDPNTAAEFLDNALPADRLEAFERVCVESDLHLADVAACHRLLAESAREPAAIESFTAPMRRRLVELAAARLDPLAAAALTVAVGSEKPVRPFSGPPVRPEARRAPLGAWISAVAAVALLAALGGFFAWSVSRGPRRAAGRTEVTVVPAEAPAEAPDARPDDVDRAATVPPPSAQPVEEEVMAVPPAAEVDSGGVVASGPPDPGASATVPAADTTMAAPAAAPPVAAPAPGGTVAGPAGESPATAGIAPPAGPSSAATSAAAPGLAADGLRVPSGDALAIVAAPPAAGAAEAVGSISPRASVVGQSADEGNDDRGATAAFRPGGPLLHRGETDGSTGWVLLPVEASLGDREDLLAPPRCHPVVEVGGLAVRLEPCSRAVVTRTADGTPWLELVFGRAVVSGADADARLGVVAGGLRGILSGVMREPAGIEVTLCREPGAESTPFRRASVSAGSAEKVWRQVTDAGERPLAGLAPEVILPARAAISWTDLDPAAAALVPPAAEPPWLRPPLGGDRIEQAAVRALADALAAGPDTTVDGPLRRLAADRRVERRMIAAATLALLGEYRDLVGLLVAEGPLAVGESQWTELERMTVPLAIARGGNSAAALAAAFAEAAPPGKGDTLMALARGFNDAELAAGGAALLVEALDDGSLAVRRSAIRRLLEIVEPDQRHRASYRADRPPALRHEGVAWWRAQLEQGRIGREGGRPEAENGRPSRGAE